MSGLTGRIRGCDSSRRAGQAGRQEMRVAKTRSLEEKIERDFKVWLAAGGEQKIREAMARAKATSDEFARSTRVRTETLYEPVAF